MIKILSRLALIFTFISAIALIMKATKLPGTSFLFLITMFSFASITFIVAIVIILPKAFLTFFIKIAALGVSVAAVGALYSYLYWMGGPFILLVGMVQILAIIPVLINLPKIKEAFPIQYRTLVNGLLFPALFIFLCGIIKFTLPPKTFYETFSQTALKKTYEQFNEENAEYRKQHRSPNNN